MTATTLNDHIDRERNAYDLLRLIAAAAVIVSHAPGLLHGDANVVEPLSDVTPFTLGQHAVNVFFVLSGVYVTASALRERSLAAFVVARVLRIWPALLAMVATMVFLVGPLLSSLGAMGYVADGGWLRYFVVFPTALSLAHTLPGVFDRNPYQEIAVPLWTLRYEIACYAVIALLMATGFVRSRGAAFATGVAMALPYPLLAASGLLGALEMPMQHLVRFLFCFGFGVSAFAVRERFLLSWPVALAGLGLASVSLGTALAAPLFAAATGYAALVLGRHGFGIVGAFARRADLSYGTYVWGWPVAQILIATVPGLTSTSLAVVGLGLTLVLAMLSWIVVEKPAMRLKPAVLARLRPKANAAVAPGA